MTHPLDRPVWHALTGRQAHLTVTTGPVVRIDPDYGPFAAAGDMDPATQAALGGVLSHPDDRIGLIEPAPWPEPPGTTAERGTLVQMVFDGPLPDEAVDPRVQLLGERDAAEMASLARATEPGPWRAQTHRYGDYYGVRIDGVLAAMAGERLLLPGWAEVSGVCTWPQFRGQGLAPLLMRRVMRGLMARGDQPFLHCYAHNTGAIALYERMGFRHRATLALTLLAPA